MSRILTGIQSTGTPHLGNILGAIIPALKLANEAENESFLFIADMHSLTQIKDSAQLKENSYATAATWLAFGLDTNKTVFYRQSDVPQVSELMWYLLCLYPFNRLSLAHSFKDKADRMDDEVNRLREDIPQITVTHEDALRNAPKKDSDYFRIPKVLDK